MNIIWDEEQSDTLKKDRRISLDEVAVLILEKKYVDIGKHPKRARQRLFLIPINGYIRVVPFVMDDDNNLVLKTAFPSRKFHKRYGDKKV